MSKRFPRSFARALQRAANKTAVFSLKSAIFGLEVVADLTPGVRMTGRRRLPRNMSAGFLGAEVATWAAISPSLLPRPWWVTAANVAIAQAIGHTAATSAAFVTKRGLRGIGKRPQDRVGPRARTAAHLLLGAGTVYATYRSMRNQELQAAMVNRDNRRGRRQALTGAAVGTAGYGAFLLLGEGIQATTTGLQAQLRRAFPAWLPHWTAWPLAGGLLGLLALTASDRLVWRRFIRDASLKAEELNKIVFPGSAMPWEPERSGSPWSHEPWTAVGSQGRAFLARGPRAADIQRIMGFDHAHEPIRIFAGLIPGRSFTMSARRVVEEMERTGAFRRDTIVLQMPAGSGWLNNYSTSAYEFLTRGDCATVTMQFSFLPSVFAFVVDRAAPVAAAAELIAAVASRIQALPEDNRPKFYLAGESLGAYAIVENYDNAAALLSDCDGALFTGPPRMTRFMRRLARDRAPGSLERLPLVDDGKHVRFVAHPDHLHHDAFGAAYQQEWQRPRLLVAQHASDPIVWWELALAYRRPDWIHEAQPATLHADTFPHLLWTPFVTFWQVALDQLNSLHTPGGHGHNYFEEMLYYWEAVLGSQTRTPLTPELADAAATFIRRNQEAVSSDFRAKIKPGS